jgi:hypothetical protein
MYNCVKFEGRSEVSMVVKIQVRLLWIVMPYSVAAGYQCCGGSCCLHLQGSLHPEYEGNKVI